MSTKDKVLDILLKNENISVSGSEIASQIGVSRNSVWKAVRLLKESGYIIKSTNNKGYMFLGAENKIKKELIENELAKVNKLADVYVFDKIASTNNEAKKLASEGCREKSLICANSQTNGKGRLGRSFVSDGSGIYLSVVLRPRCDISKTVKITSGAAVAVKRVIEKYCDDTKIKWVNDIYIGKKKVCGILTEAVSDFESGGVEYAVVGIGVNVFGKAEDFGAELKDIVTTMEEHLKDGKKLDKNVIVSQIYSELIDIYNSLDVFSLVMKEYRESCFVIGKQVFAVKAGERTKVTVTDVDDNGALVCEDENKNKILLSSGEISIRFE